MFNKILLAVFYFILAFCVFSQFGFTDGFWEYACIPLLLALLSVVVNKTYMLTYGILFLYLFQVTFYHFGNFFVDLISPPTLPAMDCDGALPMNGNWIRGAFYGFLMNVGLVFFYVKRLKSEHVLTSQNLPERIFAGTVLLLIVVSFVFPGFFETLFIAMKQVSKPTVIYPEGCWAFGEW